MKLTKLRLTKEASNRVRFLSGKTGLQPNFICRIGFCLSLEEPSIPNADDFPEEDREFNRYTLLGEYDALFTALLVQRCREDGIPLEQLSEQFRAHVNRGLGLLQSIRGISDIADLVLTADEKKQ